MKHLSQYLALCALLAISTLHSKHEEPSRGCPHVHPHCFNVDHKENKLIEVPNKQGEDYYFRTDADGYTCRTRTDAHKIYDTASSKAVCGNAEYFALGENPRATLGQMVPELDYVPLARSLPLYKITFTGAHNMPEPGDIVSTKAAAWHYTHGAGGYPDRWEEISSAGDTGCPFYALICSNDEHKYQPDDFYTGILYPGCKSGWFGCDVCPKLKNMGNQFCRENNYKYALFPKINFRRVKHKGEA